MRIAFMNEHICILRCSELDLEESCSTQSIIEQGIRVKTADDLVAFLEFVPYSFAEKFAFSGGSEEMMCDLLYEPQEERISGDVFTALNRGDSQIEYLDRYVISRGAIGKCFIKRYELDEAVVRENEEVLIDDDLMLLYLESLLDLILNLQSLAKLAALAVGSGAGASFETVELDSELGLRLIKSGLSTSDEHDKNQDPLLLFFQETERQEIIRSLIEAGYEERYGGIGGLGVLHNEPFVVPSMMEERDWAASIFAWFMNSLFEGDADSFYVGNTFKVALTEHGFHVMRTSSPLRDFYHAIADLAAEKRFGVCPICGHPVLIKKTQGAQVVYCSNSCKTRASSRRKARAFAYAAAGVPIDEAIRSIGTRYESSIRRWYDEAHRTFG